MCSLYKLAPIVVVAALTACDAQDDSRVRGDSRSDVLHQRVDATTPLLLNRSYQAILGSMPAPQRKEFLAALAAIMKSCGNDTAADAAFRKKIDGKTVSTLIADAKGLHQD